MIVIIHVRRKNMQRNHKYSALKPTKDIFFILLGSLIASVGVNTFLIHAQLLSGGLTGIALIIQYVGKVQAGITVLVLNIPIFILSYYKLNKTFTIYSIIGTVSFSVFLMLTDPLSSIVNLNDKLLLCIYGGVLSGLGFGTVFVNNGSTGGFDIISMLLRKKYGHINLGRISLILNSFIVLAGIGIFGLSNGLYTLICMYVSSVLVDKVIEGLNRNKMIFIITDKEDEIKDLVIKNLMRGVTFFYGEGAYTNKNKRVICTVVHMNQVQELKLLVKSVDPTAFMTFMDASEVEGKGFRKAI